MKSKAFDYVNIKRIIICFRSLSNEILTGVNVFHVSRFIITIILVLLIVLFGLEK